MQNIPKRDFTNMTKQEEQLLEDEVLLDTEEVIDDSAELEEEDFDAEIDETENLEEMDLDTKNNGTEAAATLRAGSSKTEMMSTLQNAMSGMSKGDMVKFFELAMGAAKEFPEKIPDGAAAKNKHSVDAVAKPVSEDLEAIFGSDSDELSEDLKEKMSTLFEAAINSELQIQVARIEESYEEKLKEEISTITTDITEQIDSYLDYIGGEWLKENQVAVEASLKTELAESFINDLGALCRNYNLDLPEGQDDLIETLTVKVDELEEALNTTEAKNIELNGSVTALQKEIMIEQMAEEISPVSYKKFKTLAENIEYDGDEETYIKKLNYIKEGFFSEKKATPSSKLINEQIAEDADDGEEKPLFEHADVKNIYDAISRTAKR